MRHSRKLSTALIIGMISLVPIAAAQAATCTPTGFIRDGNNLTARYINNATVVSPVDATGCDIGVYRTFGTLTLNNVEIFGARYFGVFANADLLPVTVHLTNNNIHDIGDGGTSGNQRGVGILLRAFSLSTLTGEVDQNTIYAYQKGGIVAEGNGIRAAITANTIVGAGRITYIAQNGIEVAFGAKPSEVNGNLVYGNSYGGPDFTVGAGILVTGGPYFGTCPSLLPCPYTTQVGIGRNIVLNNDVGVYMFNSATGVTGPPTPTLDVAYLNLFYSDACFNPYTVAISDLGNTDYMLFNYVVPGGGYDPPCGLHVDTSGSINPVYLPYPGTTIVEGSGLKSSGSIRPLPVPFGF
jgi:hypothetical protein